MIGQGSYCVAHFIILSFLWLVKGFIVLLILLSYHSYGHMLLSDAKMCSSAAQLVASAISQIFMLCWSHET